MDYGIQITKDEANEILAANDPDGCGTVHYDQFLNSLKCEMSASRAAVVK